MNICFKCEKNDEWSEILDKINNIGKIQFFKKYDGLWKKKIMCWGNESFYQKSHHFLIL